MGGKEGSKGRLETATISDVSYFFGLGNYIFIRKKTENGMSVAPCDRVFSSCNFQNDMLMTTREGSSSPLLRSELFLQSVTAVCLPLSFR